jgi:hypothetical protein
VTEIQLREGFVAAKFEDWELGVGRFIVCDGFGTVNGGPYMDGGHVAYASERVKANAYVVKFGNPGQRDDYYVADKSTYTFTLGDIKVTPCKGLTLSGSWLYDIVTKDPAPNQIGGKLYQSVAVGAEYQYVRNEIPWFAIQGEYGVNSAAMAKKFNGTTTPFAASSETCVEGAKPKAYFILAKFLGANPFKPLTGGLRVEYKYADAGFDLMYMSHPDTWNAPFNWTSPATGGIANNVKGVEVGGELTLFPRLVFKANYGFMKLANTTSSLDLGSPALATVSKVTSSGVTTITGAQNKANQDYFTAALFYIF